ncbi:MAG: proline racemase family protein [Vicinamibacteraceae bacterium]
MARRALRTLDAHVAGQTVRLVAGGLSAPNGRTMKARLADARERLDDARLAVTCEPRGHADLVGALLAEATEPTAHAGLLSFDATDWRSPSTIVQMAALRLAVDSGLLTTGDPEATLVVETPAGVRELRLGPGGRITALAIGAQIMGGSCAISLGPRTAAADVVACAGGMRAIVDAEAVGLSLVTLERRRLGELRAAVARGLVQAGYAAPLEELLVTGPAHGQADVHVVAVSESGRIDRSPTGEGAAAVVTVLDAIGLVDGDRIVTIEGPSGGVLEARIVARVERDGAPAVDAEIGGTAWMIGEHTWYWDDDDPLGAGFVM